MASGSSSSSTTTTTTTAAPQAEFYFARVAKAAAVPAAARPHDVAAFLSAHAAAEQALSLLQRMKDEEQPDSDQQTAAILNILCAATGAGREQPCPLQHPAVSTTSDSFDAVLRPLLTLRTDVDGTVVARPTRLYKQLLAPGAAAVADIGCLARLLLLAQLSTAHPARSRQALAVAARSWDVTAAAQAVEAQLQRLRDNINAAHSSAEAAWQVPCMQELRAVVLHLRIMACIDSSVDSASGLDPELEQQLAADVAGLLDCQPLDPRSHDMAGRWCKQHGPWCGQFGRAEEGSRMGHWLRGLELARQRGSQVLVAKLGYQVAILAVEESLQALSLNINPLVSCMPAQHMELSPRQADAMFAEAEAAYAAVKGLVPFTWLAELTAARMQAQPLQRFLARQLAFDADRWSYMRGDHWGPENMASGAFEQFYQNVESVGRRVGRAQARSAGLARCDGCGRAGLDMQRCSACRQAQYCRSGVLLLGGIRVLESGNTSE